MVLPDLSMTTFITLASFAHDLVYNLKTFQLQTSSTHSSNNDQDMATIQDQSVADLNRHIRTA